ncbi:MAG: EamA family transporter [Rhabdochlamydiaceae bacterium]|nr:EamA family transporter [Rhabdochlamydiaceae bacterium]
MSILLVILMYATWSSVFSLGKIALSYAPPLFLTGARMTMAGLLLLTFIAFTKRSSFRLSLKQMASIGLLAFFCIYLTNTLEFWGLQYLTAAKTCFIYSLSPFFAALFSYLHFGEKMNGRKWIGLGIGFIGFIPVLLTQTGTEDLLNAFSFFSWPTLAIIGAALFSVYGWVLLRLMVKDQALSPLMANGGSMLIGGVLAFVHSFFVESWNPIPVAAGSIAPFMKWTLIMTVLYNLICYNLYGVLLKRFTATFLSFVGLLSPIFASLNGWLFLAEPLSPVILMSTGVVSLGLWIVYQAELKQGYIVSSKGAPVATEASRDS